MIDTVTEEAAEQRAPSRPGDRIFSGLSMFAGITILVALAGVFIFLMIEGIPGLTQPAAQYAPRATNFLGYVWPLLFGTILAAVIAVIIAAPLSFGIALVISHYARKSIATPAAYGRRPRG